MPVNGIKRVIIIGVDNFSMGMNISESIKLILKHMIMGFVQLIYPLETTGRVILFFLVRILKNS